MRRSTENAKTGLPVLDAEDLADKGPRYGCRHTQVIMMFLLLTVGYSMRVNLSVGIVAMTNSTTTKNPDIPAYNWTDKSTVLSSFFWGYVCLQVGAGELMKDYGPKWFVAVAMVVNSLGCIFTPLLAAKCGSYGVMGCRIVQGLFQGFFFPSVHTILGQWVPASERSRLGNFVFAGSAFGTIIAIPITGMIAASWAGWPTSFYLWGSIGCLWSLLWAFVGCNRPSEHKKIVPAERKYIEMSLGTEETKVHKTPWKAIFTSLPVWAIIVANFGQNWGYATLLTEIPNYINEVMGLEMSKNAWLSAAPYLALFLLAFAFGSLSDYLINNHYLSRVNTRKLMNTIGTAGPAIALTTLGFMGNDQKAISIILLVLAVGINAAIWCGFQVNHVDLSPKYSGVLMGIGNGSSNIFSIISPLVVQAVVTDEHDRALWRTIFIISSAVYLASDIFYLIFASGERQWWDKTEEEDNQSQETVDIRTKY